MKAEAVIE
jgi:hypothetical protein